MRYKILLCLILFLLPLLATAQSVDNLLLNGDMNAPFNPQATFKAVPEGWVFFTLEGSPDSDRHTWPPHSVSAPFSWKMLAKNQAWVAGGYQQVNAMPGKNYRFSANVFLWTCNDEAGCINDQGVRFSVTESGAQARIGIDPNGGTDPASSTIVWGEWASPFDAYTELTLELAAESVQITVFVMAESGTAMTFNEAYWDNLGLVAAESTAESTEAPTEAPPPTTAGISPPAIAPPAVSVTATPTPTEAAPSVESSPAPEIAALVEMLEATEGTICVNFFEDANQNGRFDPDEVPLSAGEIMLAGETQISRDELWCAADQTPGTITIAAHAPANYGLTTPAELAVQVFAGRTTTVNFGAASGFTPPPTPVSVEENLNPPSAIRAVTVVTTEEDDSSLLNRIFDYSAYIMLSLAVTVLLGGTGLLLLLRTWR